ncbi:hypothetical protein LINGRAHAP2_LOCUS33848 [Linum grandiflorum]
MDKASMKLGFLVVLLIFIAGETSNIGAEARVDQFLPCVCTGPCYCSGIGCVCPQDSPLTSQPDRFPWAPPLDPPMPPMPSQ